MIDEKDEFTRYREKAKAQSSKAVLQGFLDLMKHEMHLRSEDVQPSHSFWYHRPTRDFPPKSIRYPSDYDGSDRLNIVCTQTELKAGEQKKLVESWCEVLPSLDKVEYVWFSSRANQELFDAVCDMKSLKGLYIKWSGIKSIDNIVRAKGLKYLHIGSSPSLAPLEPLGDLPSLEWLELENIKACSDLSFVRQLTGLKGLSIAGDGNSIKYLKAKTLEPMTALQDLYWLSLGTFMVEEDGLLPLAKLGKLKYLSISNKYKFEEVAALAGARPDIECDLFEPVSGVYDFFACKKCGEKKMVLPTGKGKLWMCQSCDAVKIQKHRDQFNKIASQYLKWSSKR
ncbi:hypothetical protein [Marinobacterium sediminicola]|uniref:Leucine-rich repeat domain-containing protein n=1 Tax=Marinobacterium sediminicola TaxID=518898 RepID=A0ABY1RWT1_9GAMM|nr:hypothetical protein [Marinobacterium sediminicola]ULG70233.1 hypothetical protein LN244_05315 [Marinobacterium sediminicola]SMR70026.1 hypothetical protein SAMN04487964_101435 [Marinobacterium sediminicola]